MKYLEEIRRKFFGETEPPIGAEAQDDLVDTAPLPASILQTVQGDMRSGGYHVGSAQLVGRQRKENEDSLFVLTASEIGEDSMPEFGLFCVADGLGGHGHGGLASVISLRTITRYLLKEQFLYHLDPLERSSGLSVKEIMHRAFELADSSVNTSAMGGSTTLTAVLLHGNHLTIGHVGDTRAYLINDGKIQLVTRDHSVPWRLVEIGQLTPEEARTHPQRNLLWNAVGKGENLFIDVFTYPVPSGGYLLLCSDGLWAEIPDSDIPHFIEKFIDPYITCEAMVQQADASSGLDNITAVLVAFSVEYGKGLPYTSNEYFSSLGS